MRPILILLIFAIPALVHAMNRPATCGYNLLAEPELRAVIEKQTKLQFIPNGLTANEFCEQIREAAVALSKIKGTDPLVDKAYAKIRKIQQISEALNFIYPLQLTANILPAGQVELKNENEMFESIEAKVFEAQRMDLSSTPMAYVTIVKIRLKENLRAKFKAKNPNQRILPMKESFATPKEARDFSQIVPLVIELINPLILKESADTQIFAFISRPTDRTIAEFLTANKRLALGYPRSFISEVKVADGEWFYKGLRAELIRALNFSGLPKKYL